MSGFIWWSLIILLSVAASLLLAVVGFLVYILWRYLGPVLRIFQERPLFIVPRGQPIPGSEEVRFPTTDGLTLAGSYLRTIAPQRRGVVLFGPEFGSNRWSCTAYCGHLLAAGFDLFTFDFRNHGDSDSQPGYEPLQWVCDHEVADVRAAIAYLKQRPDADPRGIGFFGVSRGGGAGIMAAAKDAWVRCVITDGAFATLTTMVPYMKKWIALYAVSPFVVRLLPNWLYFCIAYLSLRWISKERRCRYPRMERAIRKLSPRPLLMIHGEKDTYIKPPIAERLFTFAREPKEFWLVAGGEHNQALHVAGEAYRSRLLEFFGKHLGNSIVPPMETRKAIA